MNLDQGSIASSNDFKTFCPAGHLCADTTGAGQST
jgi:hypothetical protein